MKAKCNKCNREWLDNEILELIKKQKTYVDTCPYCENEPIKYEGRKELKIRKGQTIKNINRKILFSHGDLEFCKRN